MNQSVNCSYPLGYLLSVRINEKEEEANTYTVVFFYTLKTKKKEKKKHISQCNKLKAFGWKIIETFYKKETDRPTDRMEIACEI